MKITEKEVLVLEEIKGKNNEFGHSEFISTDAKTKSVAGVVASLEKKGLVYNSYGSYTKDDFKDMDVRPFKMWCLTDEGAKIVGEPKGWA